MTREINQPENARRPNGCDLKEAGPIAATSRRAITWLFAAVCGSFAVLTTSAQAVGPSHVRQNDHWLQEHLLNAKSWLPFSFVYGR